MAGMDYDMMHYIHTSLTRELCTLCRLLKFFASERYTNPVGNRRSSTTEYWPYLCQLVGENDTSLIDGSCRIVKI